MRKTIVMALLLLVPAGPGLADDCADKFAQVLVNSQNMKPTQARTLSGVKGGAQNESEFLSVSRDHYMTKPTKPKGPWVLAFDGGRYQSSDEGKSWKKFQSFDKAAEKAGALKTVKAQAASVRNAVCGKEELDGVMHETLEADTTNPAPNAFEIHTKYWVNRDAGDFVTRADMTMKMSGMEMLTSQTWKEAPGLTLPKPE